MKPSVIDRKYQCEIFNSVYGDVEKAKRVSSSPVRMFYEKRIFELAHRDIDTSNYSCLDLGCGRGLFTQFLVDKFRYVVASDFAINALFTAKTVLSQKDVDFVSSDAVALPMKDSSFDFIEIKDFIHHLADPEKVMQEIHRVLRIGGYLVSVEPNNRNIITRLSSRMIKHERKCLENSPSFLVRFITSFGFRLIHTMFDGFYVPYGPFYKLSPKMLPLLQIFEDTMKRIFPFGGGHFIAYYQKIL